MSVHGTAASEAGTTVHETTTTTAAVNTESYTRSRRSGGLGASSPVVGTPSPGLSVVDPPDVVQGGTLSAESDASAAPEPDAPAPAPAAPEKRRRGSCCGMLCSLLWLLLLAAGLLALFALFRAWQAVGVAGWRAVLAEAQFVVRAWVAELLLVGDGAVPCCGLQRLVHY